MSKARKKSAAKSTTRTAAKPAATAKQTALAARAAKAITKAISRSKKGAGKRGQDDMDIHVHVGDVVMMGFDEAVDAEEWGARETNNEFAGKGKGRGKAAGREADPQDEKGRKVRRSITLNKGKLKLQAVERSEPAKKKAARKGAGKPATKKAKRRR